MKKEVRKYYYCKDCGRCQMIPANMGPVLRWFCITCNKYTNYER